jgi:hypothetical protein
MASLGEATLEVLEWIASGEPEALNEGNDRSFESARWETDRVLWRNAQWAVTTYGIENVSGPYHYFIEKARLGQSMGVRRDWRDHMAEKTWVIERLFDECFKKAVEIHG